MRLVMTLLVRDEVDIVEAMLETHMRLGVDHVIATDNGSTDGTTEILERYRRLGRLTLIREPADDYAQAAWVTRMARLAATDHGADWVLNADADEFWVPLDGDLRSVLRQVDEAVSCLELRRYNFVLRPEDGRPPVERLLWRRRDSLTHDGHQMGPKVLHRGAPEVQVAMGNHAVRGLVGRTEPDDRIEVLHLPLRSFAQYEQKVRKGAAALRRNASFGQEVGFHWRSSDELRRAGTLAEAWSSWMHDDERLRSDLNDGVLVQDTRILAVLGLSAPRAG